MIPTQIYVLFAIFIILFALHGFKCREIEYNKKVYRINTCPCGLTKMEFEKEFRWFSQTCLKEEIENQKYLF